MKKQIEKLEKILTEAMMAYKQIEDEVSKLEDNLDNAFDIVVDLREAAKRPRERRGKL